MRRALVAGAPACAQDLGPQFKNFGAGIYVYVGKNFKSNTGIILTQDGVVLIDSGRELGQPGSHANQYRSRPPDGEREEIASPTGRKCAADLVALNPDVVLAIGISTVAPLLQLTRTVPVQ